MLEAQRAAGRGDLEVAAALHAAVAADEESSPGTAQMQAARAACVGRGHRNAKSASRGKSPLETLLVGERAAPAAAEEPVAAPRGRTSRLTSPVVLSPPKSSRRLAPVTRVSVVASIGAQTSASASSSASELAGHSPARAPARRCLEPASGGGPFLPPGAREGALRARAPTLGRRPKPSRSPAASIALVASQPESRASTGLAPEFQSSTALPLPALFALRTRPPLVGPQAVDGPIVPRPSRKPTTGSPAIASSSTTAAPPSATSQVIGVPAGSASASGSPSPTRARRACTRALSPSASAAASGMAKPTGASVGAARSKVEPAASACDSSRLASLDVSRRKQPGSARSTIAAASARHDARQRCELEAARQLGFAAVRHRAGEGGDLDGRRPAVERPDPEPQVGRCSPRSAARGARRAPRSTVQHAPVSLRCAPRAPVRGSRRRARRRRRSPPRRAAQAAPARRRPRPRRAPARRARRRRASSRCARAARAS